MKKKSIHSLLITVFLCIAIFCNPVFSTLAEEYIYLKIRCFSNLTDDRQVEICIDNQQAYLNEEDAAQFSGYIYMGCSGESAYYERAGELIEVPMVAHDNRTWVTLDWAMYLLHTKVLVTEAGLVFDAQESTPYEVFAIADDYMLEGGKYNLIEDGDFWVKAGAELAELYNRITHMKLLGYNEEKYIEILRKLLQIDEDTELVSTLIDTGEVLDIYTDLIDMGLDESDWNTVIDLLDKMLDPANSLSDMLIDKEGISISGLGAFDHVELYAQIKSIVNLTDFARNQILYTYSEDVLNARENFSAKYAPNEAVGPIRNIITYSQQLDAEEMIWEILQDEATNAISGTGNSILYDLITQTPAPKLAALACDKIVETVLPDLTNAMDGVETYAYLGELQSYLPSIYEAYRESPDTAINAKYTTILYLRILQQAYETGVESGILEAKFDDFVTSLEATILKLASMDDNDLTLKNLEYVQITPDMLYPIGNLPIDGNDSIGDLTSVELLELWNASVEIDRRVDISSMIGNPVDPCVGYIDGVEIGYHAQSFLPDGWDPSANAILIGMNREYGNFGYIDAYERLPFFASLLEDPDSSLKLLKSELYRWEYVDGDAWPEDYPFVSNYEFYLFNLTTPEGNYVFLVSMYLMYENGEAYDLEIID